MRHHNSQVFDVGKLIAAGILGCLLLPVATGLSAANIYKCKLKDGSMVVSNTPCAHGAEPDAKLSGGSAAAASYRTPCERVESTGAGLVQIASKLTPAQTKAVAFQAFGRVNSAGASRVLAEIGRGGVLRVCAFFPGGGSQETLINEDGTVRRASATDADESSSSAGQQTRR